MADGERASVERVSVERARGKLGDLMKQADTDGTHFVISRHSQNLAALVSMDFYRRARAALDDPTDL